MPDSVSEIEANAERLDVRSSDGTSIAVFVEGNGPPLVMVHGGISDHRRLEPLMEELRSEFTVYSMDRRGRGASGDTGPYQIEREFEDVSAVADTAAARSGRSVAVFGHSYGANCAMGGASLTRNIQHLILYEPGLGFRYPPGSLDAAREALEAGDIDRLTGAIFIGAMGATEDEVGEMQRSPMWPMRLQTLPTLPRELAAEAGWVYTPGRFRGVEASTLLLAGSESPEAQAEATRMAAEAIERSRVRVLAGHGHFAIQTDPALVAAVIREFLA